MTSIAHRRRIDTHRLYQFEELTGAIGPYSNKLRSQPFLRQLVDRVWTKHGRKGLPPPAIRFGPGTPVANGRISYCLGYSEIELIASHRTVGVLLHEIVHAPGYLTHGRGFVRKYFDLLVEYGRCERAPLLLDAKLFKMKV